MTLQNDKKFTHNRTKPTTTTQLTQHNTKQHNNTQTELRMDRKKQLFGQLIAVLLSLFLVYHYTANYGENSNAERKLLADERSIVGMPDLDSEAGDEGLMSAQQEVWKVQARKTAEMNEIREWLEKEVEDIQTKWIKITTVLGFYPTILTLESNKTDKEEFTLDKAASAMTEILNEIFIEDEGWHFEWQKTSRKFTLITLTYTRQ